MERHVEKLNEISIYQYLACKELQENQKYERPARSKGEYIEKKIKALRNSEIEYEGKFDEVSN